ncbi:MAG: zinc ribbon domain-containing protein [Thermodesulfobacteriota bacterium]|nr:zinc ribbon domain-containing protein [Thermodesulfobacteriota bacterium]
MPIYEYTCEKCGDEFEELIFHEGDTVKCPACGSQKTKKMISKCRFKCGSAGGGISEGSSKSGACASCSGGDCSTCGG